MSDLISRSKIRNYIKNEINPYGKPFEGTAYELGLKIMKYIDSMHSAYDIKNVVAELENKSLKCKMESAKVFCEEDYRNNTLMQYVKQSEDMKAFAYDKAIEIVKAGGIDG